MKKILPIILMILISLNAETLFEVKDTSDNTVFSISDDGMRVFNLGDTLMVISSSDIKAYIGSSKDRALSRSFSISTNTTGKDAQTNVLEVTTGATYMSEGGLGRKYTDFSPENIFIGLNSGLVNTGINNVFLGNEAGLDNLGANENNFIGFQAGFNNTTGYRNNFIGFQAGYYNTLGYMNTFIGTGAGLSNVDGDYNSLLGYYSGYLATLGNYNVFSGYYSGYNADNTSNCVYLGSHSGRNADNSTNSVAIGYSSGYNNNAANNVFMGYRAGYSNTTGHDNAFLGSDAGYYCNGSVNVLIGFEAGKGTAVNDAQSNVCIGESAAKALNDADHNVYIGRLAGYANANGDRNVYLGSAAGMNNTGQENTFLGYFTGINNYTGTGNTFVGYNAGTASGSNTSGNVCLGYYAGGQETGSNKLYIDNGNTTTPLIYGDFSSNLLRFTANVGIGVDNTSYGLYVKDDYLAIYGDTDGSSTYIYGVYGDADGGTTRSVSIYGSSASGTGTNWAGYFSGDINVTGTVVKSADQVKIDHPLDPENKFLYHADISSDKMTNIYHGNVILDNDGKATIKMAEWIEDINRDFRYQLTAIGAPGPNLYISKKLSDNSFEISGGKAAMEVSWQLTGIRNDNYAKKNPLQLVKEKNSDEKGYYLHPTAYDKSEEMGIEFNIQKKMEAEADK
ncbi:MAG: hypothetical protein GQ534_07570 [Candidatus Delongbacteria bacterium]|nr:hypothetical protein [Candidatus Delongbacteria bacterium]